MLHDTLRTHWLAATYFRLAWFLPSPCLLGDMKVHTLRHIKLAKALTDLKSKDFTLSFQSAGISLNLLWRLKQVKTNTFIKFWDYIQPLYFLKGDFQPIAQAKKPRGYPKVFLWDPLDTACCWCCMQIFRRTAPLRNAPTVWMQLTPSVNWLYL